MLLAQEQINQLNQFFLAAFNLASFTEMLAVHCDKTLEDVTLGDSFTEIVFVTIRKAQQEQWLRQLIEGAHIERPNNPQIQQVANELAEMLAVSPENLAAFSHFQASFLRNDGRAPFVDRRMLRDSLKSLAQPQGEKILVVDGPPGSGKTYSHSFIQYLSVALDSFKVYYFDFKDEYFPGFGLLDLVKSIANILALPRDTIPTQGAQSARWSRELCDWLIGQTNVAGAQWWLVFDGVGQIDMTPDVYEFIERLAKQISTTSSPLRLILLGYGRSEMLPTNIQMSVRQEQITAIGKLELVGYFTRLFELKRVVMDDQDIEKLALWTMDRLANLSADNTIRPIHLPAVLAEIQSGFPDDQGGAQ